MGDRKSLYVIRFYEYSECNYLVRKVSKRTSRDFLWTVEKVFVIRIAHSGKELRLKCVHYKKKSRTVLTDDAAFACK